MTHLRATQAEGGRLPSASPKNTPPQMAEPVYFAEGIRHPQRIPADQLQEMTQNLYTASALSDPKSPTHQWYYRLACECERRGYDLTQVLKG